LSIAPVVGEKSDSCFFSFFLVDDPVGIGIGDEDSSGDNFVIDTDDASEDDKDAEDVIFFCFANAFLSTL